MTAKELRGLLYDVKDDDKVVILNEDAPLKSAKEVNNAFSIKSADKGKQVVLTFEEREGNE